MATANKGFTDSQGDENVESAVNNNIKTEDSGREVSGKIVNTFDCTYNKFGPMTLSNKQTIILAGCQGKHGLFKKPKHYIKEFDYEGKVLKELPLQEMPAGIELLEVGGQSLLAIAYKKGRIDFHERNHLDHVAFSCTFKGQQLFVLKLFRNDALIYADEAKEPDCIIRTLEIRGKKPVPGEKTFQLETPLVHDICTTSEAIITSGIMKSHPRHNFILSYDYKTSAKLWEITGTLDLIEKNVYILPSVLSTDKEGRVYIMDSVQSRVIMLDSDGKVLTDLPTSHGHGSNMAIDKVKNTLIYAHAYDASKLSITIVEMKHNF